jgi:hypothetical protein
MAVMLAIAISDAGELDHDTDDACRYDRGSSAQFCERCFRAFTFTASGVDQ